MKKQMISLTEPQLAFLRSEAERLGISMPELVRRIVDQYREKVVAVKETKEETRREMSEGVQEFPEKMKRLIETSGVTETELARQIGISQHRFYNYSNGRSVAPLWLIPRICEVLETHPNYLLGFSDDPSPPVQQTEGKRWWP